MRDPRRASHSTERCKDTQIFTNDQINFHFFLIFPPVGVSRNRGSGGGKRFSETKIVVAAVENGFPRQKSR